MASSDFQAIRGAPTYGWYTSACRVNGVQIFGVDKVTLSAEIETALCYHLNGSPNPAAMSRGKASYGFSLSVTEAARTAIEQILQEDAVRRAQPASPGYGVATCAYEIWALNTSLPTRTFMAHDCMLSKYQAEFGESTETPKNPLEFATTLVTINGIPIF